MSLCHSADYYSIMFVVSERKLLIIFPCPKLSPVLAAILDFRTTRNVHFWRDHPMTIIAQFGFNHICSLQNLAWIIPTIFCINRLSSSNKIFKVLINKEPLWPWEPCFIFNWHQSSIIWLRPCTDRFSQILF